MITPQTVSESLVKWMEDNGYGVFGTDIFLNQVPNNAPDNTFWVVSAGGSVTKSMITQESIQQFSTQIFYRNTAGAEVEHMLFNLNQQINNTNCLTIDNFYIYQIEATMPQNNDRDAENRRLASLVIATKIYVS
jgi:hypothetical protein